MTYVHAYVEGWKFNGTLEDMQIWWDNLKQKNKFLPTTQLKVWVSKKTVSTDGEICNVYNSKPTKIYTL